MATVARDGSFGPPVVFNFPLALAWIKLFLWTIFTMLPIGIVYTVVVSDGWRQLVPALGIRFAKVPFLSFMGSYKVTERIDGAYFFALAMMLGVWYFWDKLLPLWLDGQEFVAMCRWKHAERFKAYVMTMGVVLIVADAYLFMTGITKIGWRGNKVTASAVVATAAYIAVIIFVSFVAVNLKKNIHELKRKDQ